MFIIPGEASERRHWVRFYLMVFIIIVINLSTFASPCILQQFFAFSCPQAARMSCPLLFLMSTVMVFPVRRF